MNIQKEKHTEAKKCPICNSNNIVQKSWILRNNYHLGVCNNCSFQFTQPRPELNYLIDYYNSISSVRFYKFSDERTLNDSKLIYTQIKKYHPQAKRVLEIGGSTGYYLQGLKLRGYQVVGSELSSDAVNLAKEWYDIEMYESEFPPQELKNSFDVVIIHHVIEHVIDPVDFFEKAGEYLSEGGIFIVETPNIKSWGIKLFKNHYPVFCPPGHLNFFSKSTIVKAVSSSYIIEEVSTNSNGGHTIYNIVNATLSRLGIKDNINNKISKKEEIVSKNEVKTINNKKYSYLKLGYKISKGIQFVFTPLFYLFDKMGLGENLTLVSKKLI
jgi:2-polyprenyl-3-methyl-5-hydroxy-6-metoxy-1,4-benzoquinol methylase